MTREQALQYVTFGVDDAQADFEAENIPEGALDRAQLVVWQIGKEPLVVAVWSHLPDEDPPDMAEAEELATELLVGKNWFVDSDDPEPADSVFGPEEKK